MVSEGPGPPTMRAWASLESSFARSSGGFGAQTRIWGAARALKETLPRLHEEAPREEKQRKFGAGDDGEGHCGGGEKRPLVLNNFASPGFSLTGFVVLGLWGLNGKPISESRARTVRSFKKKEKKVQCPLRRKRREREGQ